MFVDETILACNKIEVGTPVAGRPPPRIPACSFPAPYVVRHIRCVMWSTWLCGAAVQKAQIHWVFRIPRTT